MIHWLKNSLRGVCMGVADLIPGVSGGTIALILGIYTQFVGALSALGPAMAKACFKRAFWGRLRLGLKNRDDVGDDEIGLMAGHVLFLASLVVGIGLAIVVGVRFIPDLLESHPEQMNGLFFGLVVASILIPYRKMREPRAVHIIPFAIFLVATVLLVGTSQSLEQRAAGTIEIRFDKPLENEVKLDSTRHGGVRFMTDRLPPGQEKREIAFVPARPQVLPAGTTVGKVNILARMRGAAGNLAAGELSCATPGDCEARLQGLPKGTFVTQDRPLEGGSDPSLLFIFLAGIIAISAMVLPGISGSFILLLLGLYTYVIFSLRAAIYAGDPNALTVVGIFFLAILVGLMLFARVLKWLLSHHHDLTMAALVGLMAGSLRKLWPFMDQDPTGEAVMTFPSELAGPEWTTIALLAAGIAAVVVLERVGRAKISEG